MPGYKFYNGPELKKDIQAAFNEFLGTMVFLLIGLGGIQAAATSNTASLAASSSGGSSSINKVSSIEQLMYIATSMGLALLVSVSYLCFREIKH